MTLIEILKPFKNTLSREILETIILSALLIKELRESDEIVNKVIELLQGELPLFLSRELTWFVGLRICTLLKKPEDDLNLDKLGDIVIQSELFS